MHSYLLTTTHFLANQSQFSHPGTDDSGGAKLGAIIGDDPEPEAGLTGTGRASRRLRQVQIRSSKVPSGFRATTVAVTSAVRIKAVQVEPGTHRASQSSARSESSTVM